MTMPQTPWVKGVNDEYTCFSVDVQICIAPGNKAYALHQVKGEDQKVASSLPTCGEEQVAWALSQEALRREIWVSALIAQTSDETFVSQYRDAELEKRTKMARDLANKALNSLFRRMAQMGFDLSQEILESLAR